MSTAEVERGLGPRARGHRRPDSREVEPVAGRSLRRSGCAVQEGLLPRTVAAGLPHRPAHRPIAERQVCRPRSRRARPTSPGARSTDPMDPAHFDLAAPRHAELADGQGAVRPRLLCRRRSSYRLPVRVINEYAWHNLFCPQPVHRSIRRRAARTRPQFTVIDAPSFKADPQRHGTNAEVVIARELREEAGADRRHQLRRRDEEVDLHAC